MLGLGSTMLATVDLADAKSGEILVSRPPLLALAGGGGGLVTAGIVGGIIAGIEANRVAKLADGRAEQLALVFCEVYVKWLFQP